MSPAKSPKQQRFAAMCSTKKGRSKAKGKCPPVKVAKEFSRKPAGGYKVQWNGRKDKT